MTDSSDNLTFRLIQKGDLKTFEELFRRLYPALVNYANKFVRQQEIAEEITQDVFTYLWEKRSQIDIKSSLDSYLYAATKNKCLNYIKLELPKQQAQTDISEALGELENGSDRDDMGESLKKYIDHAIGTLPEKCKEIFLLSRYEGLTYEEIAEELGLSKKTVENQMGIALKKLRNILKPIVDQLMK